MRPLEILTPIILGMYLLWPLTDRKRPGAVKLLPAIALVVIASHARVEGMRWQMYPLYFIAIATWLLSIPQFMKPRQGQIVVRQPLSILLSLVLLAVSTALPILLPVPSIPAPSGPYQVGTGTYELTDSSRKELYSGRQESRRFQIQVWYPAEVHSSDERALWMEHADIFAPAIAEYIHLPSFFLDHLALVRIPAYDAATVAATREGYPVILFSHGWNGFKAQSTGQAIELASHGYVVVGVQHTYGAVITVFDDGTVAYNNPSALPSGAPDDEYEAAAQRLADQWAGDMAYALDFMERQNLEPGSPFHASLDVSRTGAYGHSTGGGAAIQFCGTDPRCKALLGMDPFMRPVSKQVLQNGVVVPSFFMFSQSWADEVDSRNNQLFYSFLSTVPESLGVIAIDGTAHYDFSDLPRLSPLASRLGLKGPISSARVTAILNDYLVGFFDSALKSKFMSLFEEQKHKYNEVRFNE